MYHRKAKRKGPVKKFKTGRVCKKTGCKQRLSVYNAQDFCNVHHREFLETY